MRISLEVKKLRGEPVHLLVQFLRLWYSRAELSRRLESLEPAARIERAYLTEALNAAERERADPAVEACLEDYEIRTEKGEWERALEIAEDLTELRGYTSDWLRKAMCLEKLDRGEAATQAIAGARKRVPRDADECRDAGATLARWGHHGEALRYFDKAVDSEPKDAVTWIERGFSLIALEREEEALASCDKASEFDAEYAWGWACRTSALQNLGRYEEALVSCRKALELDPDEAGDWALHVQIGCWLGWYDGSLTSLHGLSGVEPSKLPPWYFRSMLLSSLGRHDEALASFDEAAASAPDAPRFFRQSNRAVLLMLLGRWDEGLVALDEALGSPGQSGEPSLDAQVPNIGVGLLLIGTRDEATWRRIIAVQVELFQKHGLLWVLGLNMVSSVGMLWVAFVSREAARAWRDVWHELGAGHKELVLPLRLLNAAVEYREKPDKRILLSLPVEERKLLEPLLGIEKSAPTA